MAKIIYKEGMEGQNNLSSIEGIEIELLNGQKALIYPEYAEEHILSVERLRKWKAPVLTEIEALKVTDTKQATEELIQLESPAALWVNQFKSDKYGNFCLSSLLAAMEIQYQKEEIDELAETIEGADLLQDFTLDVWSCSRFNKFFCWYAYGYVGDMSSNTLPSSYLVVPTIILTIIEKAPEYYRYWEE